jgi:ubiquinone/menaquinone biosynthesis C-methylase UbiE
MNDDRLPKLYRELASWWPVLSAPEDYAEEAEYYRQAIVSACSSSPREVLELGSGGGNNAFHLKKHFDMTLVDISPNMLEVSHKLNPECEHFQGDMRTVRLGIQFDAVFIHDAIDYMRNENDLLSAIRSAYTHCKPGGVALFAPDDTCETFKSITETGGHDQEGRSLRYLSWTWDTDPDDSTYITYMVYVLREQDKEIRCISDQHVCGLFGHDKWLQIMSEAGFQAYSRPFEHSEIEPGSTFIFMGKKPDL